MIALRRIEVDQKRNDAVDDLGRQNKFGGKEEEKEYLWQWVREVCLPG